MKKRLVALTLVAAMALGMTACGSKSNNKTTTNDSPDTAVSTAVDWTSYDELVDSIRTETDLAKVKEQLISGRTTQLERNGYWLSVIPGSKW